MLPVPTHATVSAGAWPSADKRKRRGRARCVRERSSVNSLVENWLHILAAVARGTPGTLDHNHHNVYWVFAGCITMGSQFLLDLSNATCIKPNKHAAFRDFTLSF